MNTFCYVSIINIVIHLEICIVPDCINWMMGLYGIWAAVQILHRCSHLPNATQWDIPEAPMVMEPVFGRSEVESRLNMSHKEHSHYHTLECVASTEDEEAYTLFSISGMIALSHTLQLGVVLFMCMHSQETQTHWPWAFQGQVCS